MHRRFGLNEQPFPATGSHPPHLFQEFIPDIFYYAVPNYQDHYLNTSTIHQFPSSFSASNLEFWPQEGISSYEAQTLKPWIKRVCLRCNSVLFPLEDGTYGNGRLCSFHPYEKENEFFNYPCCGRDTKGRRGCVTCQYHTPSDIDIIDRNFQPWKRRVCINCQEVLFYQSNGSYSNGKICLYHPLEKDNVSQVYRCCGKIMGCVMAPCHIPSRYVLENDE